jgi:hypothetical protein
MDADATYGLPRHDAVLVGLLRFSLHGVSPEGCGQVHFLSPMMTKNCDMPLRAFLISVAMNVAAKAAANADANAITGYLLNGS